MPSSDQQGAQALLTVLTLGVGLPLTTVGWRLSRSTSRFRREAAAGYAERGVADYAGRLPALRGSKRLTGGVLLVVMGAFGAAQYWTDQRVRAEIGTVQVALPATALGLPRDDSVVGPALDRTRQGLAASYEQVVGGYYGRAGAGLVVMAGKGVVRDPQATASGFVTNATAKDRSVTEVASGVPGAVARCSTGSAETNAIILCAIVTEGTFVATGDTVATTVAEAMERLRALRGLIVRRSAA